MTRRAALTGLVLCLMGLALFAYKALVLDVPLVPSNPADLWHVELTVSVRGAGERGSVRAQVPSSSQQQLVFDQRTSADRLRFQERDDDGQRMGVWSGTFFGVQRLVYGFRVKLTGQAPPQGGVDEAALLAARYSTPAVEYPSDAPEVRAILERLALAEQKDVLGRVRALFAFVVEEVVLVETASSDALLALEQREGNELAKARLLVTLLRAAGLPARLAQGLSLVDAEAPPRERAWAEVWLEERWQSLSPVGEFFGQRPHDLLLLHVGDAPLVEGSGVTAFGYSYRARRERLRPDELASMMMPTSRVLSAVSLYRAPLSVQSSLRLLLLMPLGALLVAVFRNLVGLPTFGTFMPILLALALRTTLLFDGLLLLGFVVVVAVLARVLLNKLRLLVVPRLGVLLCMVVLAMTALALVGNELEVAEMFASVLFPVVILTMFVERFSLTMTEEGPKSALMTAGNSVIVAVTAYPVFKSEVAEHLMFGFPELIFTCMGLLIFLGGYTGYRLTDLRRFSSIVDEK